MLINEMLYKCATQGTMTGVTTAGNINKANSIVGLIL